MAKVIKYAYYIDQLNRIVANNTKFGPIDTVLDSFYDANGVEIVDLTTRGFPGQTLKDATKYPHSLIVLRIDDTNNVAGPGLINTPIEDAIAMGLAGFGGREVTDANALLFVKDILPEAEWDNVELGKHYHRNEAFIETDGIIKQVTDVTDL